jgi:hypothetical protein
MSRQVGMVCAGALLIATAGCSLDSFLVSFTGRDGKQHVVAGSADQVALNLQAALGKAGVAVTATRDGEDIRLAGTTRSGSKFYLRLKRQKTYAGENTAVAIEWEREADDSFWLTVVQILTAPPA